MLTVSENRSTFIIADLFQIFTFSHSLRPTTLMEIIYGENENSACRNTSLVLD